MNYESARYDSRQVQVASEVPSPTPTVFPLGQGSHTFTRPPSLQDASAQGVHSLVTGSR